jgi:hypothetical protein
VTIPSDSTEIVNGVTFQFSSDDYHGGTNQQWNVNSNGTITGVRSGLCLDVAAGGTKVQLWSCTGAANQQWSVH